MNSGKYTVDRFEGDLAVLLYRNDETIELIKNKSELPNELKEGDIIFLQLDSDGNIIETKILKEETEEARKKAKDLLNKLKNKN